MRIDVFSLIVVMVVVCIGSFLPWDETLAMERTDTIIITSDEIKRMNVHKVHDILNRLPGIRASESSVSIHGSTKVRVLLDGRPINDPTSSHGFVKFDLVPVDEIERIEVHVGKGAVKYGKNASGGVILIHTRKISAFHGNLRAYWGNFETSNYTSNLRFKKSNLGLRLSGGYEYTDGYQVNGDKEKYRAGFKGSYSVAKDFDFSVSADYLDEERGLSGRPEYPTPHSRKKCEMYSYSLAANTPFCKSESFFNQATTKNTDPNRAIDYFIKVKDFGEDLCTAFSGKTLGTVNIGGAFRWGEASSTGFKTTAETSLAVFVSHSKTFHTKHVTLSYGARGTHYSDFEDTLDPEIEITYRGKKWAVTLSYSQNNNPPSFYQRYNRTSTKEPNPDLDKEISHNVSGSFSIQFSPNLSSSATVFYNWITDRITYVLGDNGIGRYENFGMATYRGFDFQTKWQISKMVGIRFSYSFLRAVDEETGLWLVAKPLHRIYADVRYSPFKSFSAIGNVKYESKQYTRSDNRSSVPPRAIGNLRLEYSPGFLGFQKAHLELFSEIKNISNEKYLYGDGWLAPPLTWICGLNCLY